MLAQLAFVLVLLSVCGFAPGFYFIRRLRWTPLEKLCGSVGLSFLLLYLAMWVNFCLGPHDERIGCWLIATVAFVLGGMAWRDAARLLISFRVKQSLRWFFILVAWTFLMLAIIRLYSGAAWGGDWKEHFHRTLYFLNRLPLMTPMFPDVALTQRPPLMNVVTALFLGLTADRFEIFQFVFAFLNLLVFLPCVLILPALGGARRRVVLPLAVLFAVSPVMMEAATYTWTKAFPAFFIVLGIAFYVAGLRKNDPVRIFTAFVSLTAGFLAHYSVGPYLAVIVGHFMVRVISRRDWRQAFVIAAACGLLLATWFGWSAAVFGWKGTLTSNSTIDFSQKYQGSNAGKMALNLVDAIVPVWMRGGMPHFNPSAGSPYTRDNAFVFYQQNLIFAMGVVGGPLVLWLWVRAILRKKSSVEIWFWRIVAPTLIVLGMAVVGERAVEGAPHLTLLSVELLGLSLLAANFVSLPRAARFLLVAGCAVDFYFGVFLQAHVESMENTTGHVLFGDFDYVPPPEADIPSRDVWVSWTLKHDCEVARRQLVQFPQLYGNKPSFQRMWPAIKANWERPLDRDEKRWGGWARRHGDVLSHLGDWVAGDSGRGASVTEALFGLIGIGFLAALCKAASEYPHGGGCRRSLSPGSRPSCGLRRKRKTSLQKRWKTLRPCYKLVSVRQ